MKDLTLIIERLPIRYRPPFDCVNDNATCPVCKQRRGYHGVCGSRAGFGVRTEHAGKRYAVTLEVLGGDYLPITRQWWQAKGLKTPDGLHHASTLAIHREHPDGDIDCSILGEGRRCQPDGGFLAAEAIFKHGNRDATIDLREQPETLWNALERYLVETIFGPVGEAS